LEPIVGLCISLVANMVLIYLLLHKGKRNNEGTVTEEDIRTMVDVGGDNGSIDETKKEMITNILELRNISVEEIATHRTDIVAVQRSATLEEITEVIIAEKYSRIVVFDDNIDDVVGLFHVKDFLKYALNMNNEEKRAAFAIENVLMKPYFVPFSKKVDELFQEMQKEKVHMAIAIDEYGGTAGLVTMEDLLEEIVGNIQDEYDLEEEEDICILDENEYRMNGTTSLADVEEQLKITFEDNEDYDTLGGYLIGCLGRIPDDGEQPEVKVDGWLFQIEGIEEKRIEKIRVIPLEDGVEEHEEVS